MAAASVTRSIVPIQSAPKSGDQICSDASSSTGRPIAPVVALAVFAVAYAVSESIGSRRS